MDGQPPGRQSGPVSSSGGGCRQRIGTAWWVMTSRRGRCRGLFRGIHLLSMHSPLRTLSTASNGASRQTGMGRSDLTGVALVVAENFSWFGKSSAVRCGARGVMAPNSDMPVIG